MGSNVNIAYAILPALIDGQAAASPDRTFLFATDDDWELTFGELRQATRTVARCLRDDWGIAPGDHVGLLMPNGVDFVAVYFGIMSLGAVACPINTLLQDPEIDFILEHAAIDLVCASSEFADRLGREGGPGIRVCNDPRSLWDRPAAEGDGDMAPLPDVAPGAVAEIVYTSGSTGRPKGVMLSHANILADCTYIADWLGIGPADRSLCVLPLFHTNAQMQSLISALVAGASVVLPRRFSASEFWDLAARYQTTWCSAAPTVLYILVEALEASGKTAAPPNRMRLFLSGTSSLPPALLERFERAFGILIIEGYGLTETVCRVTYNPVPPADNFNPGREEGYRRFGSVGRAIGDSVIAIADDDGNKLPVDERGEVVLQGSVITHGYFNNPDATTAAFRDDWFLTGDIGYQDGDGYLYIVDRKKDLIIRGGQNIFPREVDEVLLQHPAVGEAAVIGVADEKYGEEVKAFVVAKDEAVDEQDILAFCGDRLAAYKCPKSVQFVDEMPKGPTGKLLRRRLSEIYETPITIVIEGS